MVGIIHLRRVGRMRMSTRTARFRVLCRRGEASACRAARRSASRFDENRLETGTSRHVKGHRNRGIAHAKISPGVKAGFMRGIFLVHRHARCYECAMCPRALKAERGQTPRCWMTRRRYPCCLLPWQLHSFLSYSTSESSLRRRRAVAPGLTAKFVTRLLFSFCVG